MVYLADKVVADSDASGNPLVESFVARSSCALCGGDQSWSGRWLTASMLAVASLAAMWCTSYVARVALLKIAHAEAALLHNLR